jgi:predicted dehydrogenase
VLQQTAASWTPGVAGLTVVAGTRGTLEVDRAGVWCSDANGRRLLDVPDALRLPELAVSDDPRERYTHLELGPYTRLCEALRDPSSAAVPVPTFADGLAEMQILDAIRTSAATAAAVVPIPDVSVRR